MIVRCDDCGLAYDDVYRWTFCPHDRFAMRTLVSVPGREPMLCTTVEQVRTLLKETSDARRPS